METCPFCEIISKVEKPFIIYAHDIACCFLDMYPMNKGHVLVVP
ncbi:HIT domain-containing protein [Lysinibacillus sphaericus]